MKLKSYFAGTVQAAMALAREELGPEAMLVQSKKRGGGSQQPGEYEVVFALQEAEPAFATVRPPATSPATAPVAARSAAAATAASPAPASAAPPADFGQMFASQREAAIHKLSSELEQLKQRIETMSGPLSSAINSGYAPASSPRSNSLARSLANADLSPDLAQAIAWQAASDGDDPLAIVKAVQSFIRIDPTLGVPEASRRIVSLVGPSGAGKTTAMVKLAIQYGLAERRSVHFFSTDVYRVGAAEQLRLYASILGIGFQTVETPLALAQALEEQSRSDLVFIDTPGRAHRDIPEIRELADYIGSDSEIDVHLVLPASNRAADLTETVDRYSAFHPRKLLFTRIDETRRHGPMINESYRTGLPVSFLSGGEQIPEDLEPATLERIAELVLGALAPQGNSQTRISREELK